MASRNRRGQRKSRSKIRRGEIRTQLLLGHYKRGKREEETSGICTHAAHASAGSCRRTADQSAVCRSKPFFDSKRRRDYLGWYRFRWRLLRVPLPTGWRLALQVSARFLQERYLETAWRYDLHGNKQKIRRTAGSNLRQTYEGQRLERQGPNVDLGSRQDIVHCRDNRVGATRISRAKTFNWQVDTKREL